MLRVSLFEKRKREFRLNIYLRGKVRVKMASVTKSKVTESFINSDRKDRNISRNGIEARVATVHPSVN